MKSFYKICLVAISLISVALLVLEYLLVSSNNLLLREASHILRNIQRQEDVYLDEEQQCSKVLFEQNAVTEPFPDNTSDEQVLEYLNKGCDYYKSRYRFVTQTASDEERDFPIAISTLVHNRPHQFSMLLSAIYSPHNTYCIHVDAKVKGATFKAFHEVAKCFPNVFLTSRREYIVYASFARLKADINCMKDLLAESEDWKYLVNLCGQVGMTLPQT